ncbi:uncharacterized protein [Ciconia boyciana]|uniref:uncharacterized protein isoform X2 n=1 Tax=Ciconia boyciana TaxID=52775 RepID=UPI003BA1876B
MIEACNRVGSIEHHTAVLAGAFAAALNIGRGAVGDKRCYRCHAVGHLAANCPQRGSAVGRGAGSNPPTLCPRCGKGWHWASQCRSQYNAEGQPLPTRQGNGKRSAGRKRAMTQVPPPLGPEGRSTPDFRPKAMMAGSLTPAAATTTPQTSLPWTPSPPRPEGAPDWMSPRSRAPTGTSTGSSTLVRSIIIGLSEPWVSVQPQNNIWVMLANMTGQEHMCLSMASAGNPFTTCLVGLLCGASCYCIHSLHAMYQYT